MTYHIQTSTFFLFFAITGIRCFACAMPSSLFPKEKKRREELIRHATPPCFEPGRARSPPAASTVADADEPTTTPRAHDIPPPPLFLLAEKGLENQSLLSKEKNCGKKLALFSANGTVLMFGNLSSPPWLGLLLSAFGALCCSWQWQRIGASPHITCMRPRCQFGIAFVRSCDGRHIA